MPARIPVYTDENGIHRIEIFQETDDGTFRRTGDEPLRVLRENICGVSSAVGELVSGHFDREERPWRSPTIKQAAARPQSIYEFLRAQVGRNKLFVFAKPSLSGRLSRLDLHELKLKPNASMQVRSIMARKYMEAVELWPSPGKGAASEGTVPPRMVAGA